MKTQITLFLFCFGFLNGFAQPNIDSLPTDARMGQQFLSVKLETNPSLGKSYYAIIPPVFETYTDTIFQGRKDIPIPANIKSTSRYLELKPAVFHFKQLTIDDEEAVLYLYEQELLAFEFLFIVKEFETSDYIMYNQYGDDNFNELAIIQRERLVSKSSIQKLTSKEEMAHPDQVLIEVANGKWSDFKTHLRLQSNHPTIVEIRIFLFNFYFQ